MASISARKTNKTTGILDLVKLLLSVATLIALIYFVPFLNAPAFLPLVLIGIHFFSKPTKSPSNSISVEPFFRGRDQADPLREFDARIGRRLLRLIPADIDQNTRVVAPRSVFEYFTPNTRQINGLFQPNLFSSAEGGASTQIQTPPNKTPDEILLALYLKLKKPLEGYQFKFNGNDDEKKQIEESLELRDGLNCSVASGLITTPVALMKPVSDDTICEYLSLYRWVSKNKTHPSTRETLTVDELPKMLLKNIDQKLFMNLQTELDDKTQKLRSKASTASRS